jgi:hypothetical protein
MMARTPFGRVENSFLKFLLLHQCHRKATGDCEGSLAVISATSEGSSSGTSS